MSSDNNHSVYNGKRLTIEIYGASHAEEIGVLVDGFTNGASYDEGELLSFMARRRASISSFSTPRIEDDLPLILSGAKDGVLSGETFKAVVKNKNTKSADYQNVIKVPRPSHADFVGWAKYGKGFDYRGGGKFSGRMTVALCIVGGICKQLLQKKGINITAYIQSIGNVQGASYKSGAEIKVNDQKFPLLDNSVKEDMLAEIEKARLDADSVGGKIECVVQGMPVGVGEFMFDSIEGVISRLAFAVPAVKGIEFGTGFDLTKMRGFDANDQFDIKDGKVVTTTNHNGGINGGISNGNDIAFGVAIKPTPSISKAQQSVNLETLEREELIIKGRHDTCITVRAVPVIEAITAIAIYDLITE